MGLSRSCLCAKGFLSRFLLGLALESSFVFVEWNDVSHQMHQGVNFDTMTQADYSITLGMCLSLHNLTSSFKVTGGCLPPVILCHLFCELASHWSGHEGKLQGAAGCSQASAGAKNPPSLHAAVRKTIFLLSTSLHYTLASLPALHLYSLFCSCWYNAQLILSDRLTHFRWGPSFHIYISTHGSLIAPLSERYFHKRFSRWAAIAPPTPSRRLAFHLPALWKHRSWQVSRCSIHNSRDQMSEPPFLTHENDSLYSYFW